MEMAMATVIFSELMATIMAIIIQVIIMAMEMEAEIILLATERTMETETLVAIMGMVTEMGIVVWIYIHLISFGNKHLKIMVQLAIPTKTTMIIMDTLIPFRISTMESTTVITITMDFLQETIMEMVIWEQEMGMATGTATAN